MTDDMALDLTVDGKRLLLRLISWEIRLCRGVLLFIARGRSCRTDNQGRPVCHGSRCAQADQAGGSEAVRSSAKEMILAERRPKRRRTRSEAGPRICLRDKMHSREEYAIDICMGRVTVKSIISKLVIRSHTHLPSLVGNSERLDVHSIALLAIHETPPSVEASAGRLTGLSLYTPPYSPV
jgi:hypothetical protein